MRWLRLLVSIALGALTGALTGALWPILVTAAVGVAGSASVPVALVMEDATGAPAPGDEPHVTIVMFFSPTCPHCHRIITTVLPPLEEQYGDALEVVLINSSSAEGNPLFWEAMDWLAVPEENQGVPVVIVGNRVLAGGDHSTDRLPEVVAQAFASGGAAPPELPGLEAVLAAGVEGDEPRTIAEMSIEQRLALDPVGSSIALLSLAIMLGSVLLVVDAWRPVGLAGARGGGWPVWTLPALCSVGLVVATYLAYVEVTNTQAMCGPIGSCNTVQQSSYARLFGVLPVGVLGVLGYLAILAAWIAERRLDASGGDRSAARPGASERSGRGSSERGSALDHDAAAGAAPDPGRSRVRGREHGRPARPRASVWLLRARVSATLFGVLFSLYLTFLEPFVIGAVCMWCVSSAWIMTALLWVTVPADAVRRRLARGVSRSESALEDAGRMEGDALAGGPLVAGHRGVQGEPMTAAQAASGEGACGATASAEAKQGNEPVERPSWRRRVLVAASYLAAVLVGVAGAALVTHVGNTIVFPPPMVSSVAEVNRRAAIDNAVLVSGVVIGPLVWHAVRTSLARR